MTPAEYSQAYYEKNSVKLRQQARRNSLAKRYGITLEDWYDLYDAQDGVCPVCLQGLGPRKTSKKINVEHDHATGKVRGITHSRCNTDIRGIDNNDGVWLDRVLRYLGRSCV